MGLWQKHHTVADIVPIIVYNETPDWGQGHKDSNTVSASLVAMSLLGETLAETTHPGQTP